MQVFIIGSPLETSLVLDRKRLNKQIIECSQILAALNGKKAWANHPCTKQYKPNQEYLTHYMLCLKYFKEGNTDLATEENNKAIKLTPSFHVCEYFDQMKRRLFTKDNNHYKQWELLGKSNVNWYWSYEKNCWLKYGID